MGGGEAEIYTRIISRRCGIGISSATRGKPPYLHILFTPTYNFLANHSAKSISYSGVKTIVISSSGFSCWPNL